MEHESSPGTMLGAPNPRHFKMPVMSTFKANSDSFIIDERRKNLTAYNGTHELW